MYEILLPIGGGIVVIVILALSTISKNTRLILARIDVKTKSEAKTEAENIKLRNENRELKHDNKTLLAHRNHLLQQLHPAAQNQN